MTDPLSQTPAGLEFGTPAGSVKVNLAPPGMKYIAPAAAQTLIGGVWLAIWFLIAVPQMKQANDRADKASVDYKALVETQRAEALKREDQSREMLNLAYDVSKNNITASRVNDAMLVRMERLAERLEKIENRPGGG